MSRKLRRFIRSLPSFVLFSQDLNAVHDAEEQCSPHRVGGGDVVTHKRTILALAKIDDFPLSYPAVSRPAFSSPRENISTPNTLFARPKKIENPKAEIRWEPTAFRFVHSSLLSCKSKVERRVYEYHGRARYYLCE